MKVKKVRKYETNIESGLIKEYIVFLKGIEPKPNNVLKQGRNEITSNERKQPTSRAMKESEEYSCEVKNIDEQKKQ